MKHNWSILMIVMLIIASQLSNCSCNKEDTTPPSENTCLITEVDLTDGTDHETVHLEYNADLKVSLYEPTIGILHSITRYTYAGNKIVANSDSSSAQRIYELDDNGRIENVVNNATDDEWYYDYDDNGYMIEEDFYDGDDSDKDYERVFTYTNGNCTSEVKEYGDGDIQTVNYTYYLDKANKGGFFGPTDEWIFFLMDMNRIRSLPFGTASKNLIKTCDIVDRTGAHIKLEFAYTFNNGYVATRTSKTTVGSGTPIELTTTVTYYCP